MSDFDHQRLISALAGLQLDCVIHGPERLAGRDPGWHPENFGAGILVEPADAQAAAGVIRHCAAQGIGIVPQGGRTGLTGAGRSKPGEVILSTARMNRIERLDPAERTVVAGAGVVLEQLQREAARHGLTTGIDLAARGSATLGGMVATNAGGILAFRNGVMRHQILGLEAVLPDGSIFSDLTRVVKVSAGPDIKQLFIGAEGAFGLVTRVVMKLEPLRAERASALIGLPSAASALSIIAAAQAVNGLVLEGAELMWADHFRASAAAHGFDAGFLPQGTPAVLLLAVAADTDEAATAALEELLAGAWETAGIANALVSRSLAQDRAFWTLREENDFIYQLHPDAPSFDISVPPASLDAYHDGLVARLAAVDPALGAFVFGHIADGNLHLSITHAGPMDAARKQDIETAIYTGVTELGGSFSAEHGVGTEKKQAYLTYAPAEKQSLARKLKAMFDPQGLFNSGKVPF